MILSSFFIRPSPQISGLLAAALLMSVAACWIIPISLVYRVAAAAALFVAFACAWERHVWRYRRGLWLLFRRNKEIAVLNRDGIAVHSGVVADRVASPLLSTLIIDGNRRRFVLLLMPDSLLADDYRQLRIRLKDAVPMDKTTMREQYSYLPPSVIARLSELAKKIMKKK